MAAGIFQAARLLAGAGHVTVFSGAGISVESGEIMPACQIPPLAKGRGAKMIEINTSESNFTTNSDIFLKGTATEMVRALVKELGL